MMLAAAAACFACGDDRAPIEDPGPDAGRPDIGGDAGVPPDDCREDWPGLRIGTALDDEVHALALDGAGRLAVGGFRGGRSDVARLSPIGDATGFVDWHDTAGDLVASASVETDQADVIEDLISGPDDRLFAVGRTLGSLPGFQSGGQYDLFFAVLHPEQAGPLHATQLGGPHPEHPRRLFVAGDRWVAAGFTDVYVPTNYVEDWEDPLLAGATLGAFGFTGTSTVRRASPETDFMHGIVAMEDGSGDILVAYHSTAGSSRGTWVMRVDRSGSNVWATRLSRTGFDSAVALVPDSDGNVRVVGSSFEMLGPIAYGQMDVYVASLRMSDGQVQWTTQVGTSETDWVHDAVAGPEGELYVTGETSGSFFDEAPPDGTATAFAIRVDTDGTPAAAWQKSSGERDVGLTVILDTCGRLLVGGYSTGAIVDGTPSAGGRDGFVVQAKLRALSPPAR